MTRARVTVIACAALLWAGAAFARPTPEQRCAAAKQKAAGIKAKDKLVCWAKSTKKGASFDLGTCLSKAEAKFATLFAKAEHKGGCVTNGDGAAIENDVDNFVAGVVAQLPWAAPTPTQTPTSTPTATPTCSAGQACSTGKLGICAAGTTACSGGATVCNQNQQAQAELCNGLDDDCDGQIDNGNPGGGVACDTGKLGVCKAGTISCVAGVLRCNQNVPASQEVCNGLDDDCDGQIDNGNPCPSGWVCVSGACQPS
jgi:hypothetical protein